MGLGAKNVFILKFLVLAKKKKKLQKNVRGRDSIETTISIVINKKCINKINQYKSIKAINKNISIKEMDHINEASGSHISLFTLIFVGIFFLLSSKALKNNYSLKDYIKRMFKIP